MKRSDYVYLAITNDKYELPIAIFLTANELTNWSERNKKTISCAITRQNVDRRYNCRYKKVYIGDEELCQ